MIKNKLKFAKGNAKLGKHTAIFSLPAGHTCPGALLCLSKSNQLTGKLTDGPKNQFRCYAASAENLFKNVRISRWRNFELLKAAGSIENMAALIQGSLPKTFLVRIHSSGDFYNQAYFDAWLMVAKNNPGITFYAYTKMLPLWIKRLGEIPANFKLVASVGGMFDNLITKHNLRNVKVVTSEKQAADLGLTIDHDDTTAWQTNDNFALLIHGTQPLGTEAAKIVHALRYRTDGKPTGGYKAGYFKHYDKIKQQQTPVTVSLS